MQRTKQILFRQNDPVRMHGIIQQDYDTITVRLPIYHVCLRGKSQNRLTIRFFLMKRKRHWILIH